MDGPEEYYRKNGRKVLLLVGEEVHDQARNPQKNHLLVFGARRELAPYAYDPQKLLDQVNQAGGLAFIAHPADPAAPAIGETDITWEDWDVRGFHGLEVWNWFSEFKGHIKASCTPSIMPSTRPCPAAAPIQPPCANGMSCWCRAVSW